MKVRFFTVPNLLTLANLFCGCAAIVWTLYFGDLRTAFLLMLAAALFDFLDGMAARLLKSHSPIGVQLDSLADMVSFGVLPSSILFAICRAGEASLWFSLLMFVVALFSALRLAKFNIDDEQTEEFRGLPTPASAILIGSLGWVYGSGIYAITPVGALITAVGISYFMISNTRMFSLKFKNLKWEGNEIRFIFLGLSLAAVVVFRIAAVPMVMLFYILLSIVRKMACRKSE